MFCGKIIAIYLQTFAQYETFNENISFTNKANRNKSRNWKNVLLFNVIECFYQQPLEMSILSLHYYKNNTDGKFYSTGKS